MKLISLNMEGYVRLDTVLTYLTQTEPDVICLQEIHHDTFLEYKQQLTMDGVFAPMVSQSANHKSPWGVAILSHSPIVHSHISVYDSFTEDYPEFRTTRPERPKALLQTATIKLDQSSAKVIIGCTHFTWSPNGLVSHEQQVNLKNLLNVLDSYPEIVLCGDFNSPRGQEIYNSLARRYHDGIPEEITSTIDTKLHRAGGLDLVVDGIFATQGFAIGPVNVISGVSDHCAIEAEVSIVVE